MVYLRFLVVLFAVLFAFIFYQLVMKPALRQRCYFGTKSCLRIEFYRFKNSVLIHTVPTGYWIWFDGSKIFIYGDPTGRRCRDEGFEPAYEIDPSQKEKPQYVCAVSLEKVKKFYLQKNIQKEYLFQRLSEPMDVYGIINILNRKNIINLDQASNSITGAIF